MRIFYLPQNFSPSSYLKLTGKDFNYIVKVLRLKEGMILTARDKEGKTWELLLNKIERSSCTLKAFKTEFAKDTTDYLPRTKPQVKILLYQCIPKGRKMDKIIRMATEAGVWKIIPVQSSFCVADIKEEKEETKLNRYNLLIKEAIQQSGSLVPTSIEKTIKINQIPNHLKTIGYSFLNNSSENTNEKIFSGNSKEDTNENSIASTIEGLNQNSNETSNKISNNTLEKTLEKTSNENIPVLFFHQEKLLEDQKDICSVLLKKHNTIAIIIGPEGGFSAEETSFFLSNSYTPILLKTNILRCETAAIYALAGVQILSERTCQ